MNKLFALLASSVMVLSLAACFPEDDSTNTESEPENTSMLNSFVVAQDTGEDVVAPTDEEDMGTEDTDSDSLEGEELPPLPTPSEDESY